MTVLVKIIGDLAEAKDVQDKFEWNVRNTIRAKRIKDPRWNDVMVKAYWEFDNLQETDEYGRNAKIAIEKLGMPTFTYGGAWLVHVHAIVALGDLTLDEFRATIRKENAPLPYQVDVQPFRLEQDVDWNIRRITRYSMKYRIEDHYKRTGPFDPEYVLDMEKANERKWWPRESVRLLANLLSQEYNGYRSQQFKIGPASETKVGKISGSKNEGNVGYIASVLGAEQEDKQDKASTAIRDLIGRMKSKGVGPQT